MHGCVSKHSTTGITSVYLHVIQQRSKLATAYACGLLLLYPRQRTRDHAGPMSTTVSQLLIESSITPKRKGSEAPLGIHSPQLLLGVG